MKSGIELSIIIPCLNEEEFIQPCLSQIFSGRSHLNVEVILVDGGSRDKTMDIAQGFPCRVISTEHRSRAIQMNIGVRESKGDILFFLHADAIVPPKFDSLIYKSIQRTGGFGLFAYDFYPNSSLLNLNSWFTRKRWGFTGGGDQGLFVNPALFKETGGYNEDLAVMEDFDLFHRLKARGAKWEVIQHPLQVSSRKYQNNSYLKVQCINLCAVLAFRLNVPTSKIRTWYERQLTKKAGSKEPTSEA